MKTSFILVVLCLCAVLATGCAGKVKMDDKNMVQQYSAAVIAAGKSCKTDADCVAVNKGCCPCDGQEAVNVKAVEKLQAQREDACGVVPCTLQMCYTDIEVSCVKKVCTGTPKTYPGIALR